MCQVITLGPSSHTPLKQGAEAIKRCAGYGAPNGQCLSKEYEPWNIESREIEIIQVNQEKSASFAIIVNGPRNLNISTAVSKEMYHLLSCCEDMISDGLI